METEKKKKGNFSHCLKKEEEKNVFWEVTRENQNDFPLKSETKKRHILSLVTKYVKKIQISCIFSSPLTSEKQLEIKIDFPQNGKRNGKKKYDFQFGGK